MINAFHFLFLFLSSLPPLSLFLSHFIKRSAKFCDEMPRSMGIKFLPIYILIMVSRAFSCQKGENTHKSNNSNEKKRD